MRVLDTGEILDMHSNDDWACMGCRFENRQKLKRTGNAKRQRQDEENEVVAAAMAASGKGAMVPSSPLKERKPRVQKKQVETEKDAGAVAKSPPKRKVRLYNKFHSLHFFSSERSCNFAGLKAKAGGNCARSAQGAADDDAPR